MTLLEALVALVILGLVAVGSLEAFQGTSRSTRDAEAWAHAIGYAEATMEQTKLGTGPGERAVRGALPPGFARDIKVQRWPGARGVDLVTVTVSLPGGGTFELHRLVRSQ
jgi:type II secretory pathway pseudopilin PulG